MKSERIERLMNDAHLCACNYAQRNKSDSFAYRRAHSRVLNSLMTKREFEEQDFNPHL